MANNSYRNGDRFYISNLRVLIYVIGYARYGESTVLLIMNGDTCYFAAVIDSYHYRKGGKGPFINKAADILKKHHVKRLDLLCWSHPHDDHSKGITTLLRKFCDEETNVLFPMYINANEADIVRLKHVSKDTVHKVLSDNRDRKYMANPIGVVTERYDNVDEFDIVNPYDEEDVRPVSIDAITPISNKLTKYVNENKCSDLNELSITLFLNIDGYGFYFGGDTTNEHIDASNKRRMKMSRFVKIPHHSSSTANHLLNYLPVDYLDAVCTTVFNWGKCKLPNTDVVKSYQRYFRNIYSTNKYFRQEGIGIIEYEYNFTTGSPTCIVHQTGNVGILDIVR